MADLGYYFTVWEDYGVFTYILPFLLVFTIIFAVLEKTKIFGAENNKPRTNINSVIALVIALIVVVNTRITEIMSNYLTNMALAIIIVMLFLLLFGLFGGSTDGFKGWSLGIFFLISIVVVFIALFSGPLGLDLPFRFSDTDKAGLFAIIAFVLIIGFVTKGSGSGSGTNTFAKEFFEGLRGKP